MRPWPDLPDPAQHQRQLPGEPELSPQQASNSWPGSSGDPRDNWLQARILEASRELLFAAEKVRHPVGSSLEDQAAAAWHVRTSQAMLDHCVEHLDDLDDEDPPPQPSVSG